VSRVQYDCPKRGVATTINICTGADIVYPRCSGEPVVMNSGADGDGMNRSYAVICARTWEEVKIGSDRCLMKRQIRCWGSALAKLIGVERGKGRTNLFSCPHMSLKKNELGMGECFVPFHRIVLLPKLEINNSRESIISFGREGGEIVMVGVHEGL